MSAAHSMLFTLVMVPTVWAQNPFPTTPNYVRAYTTGANLFNLGNAQGTSCDMLAIGRSGHAPDGIEKSGLISVFVDVEASSEATYAAYGPEEGASFGDSFTSAGDVFGDGVQDMWVVSPAKAKMYLVNMVAGTELYTSPFHPTVVDIGLNTMGSSILGNVDLDGDGFKDVILGSKGSDMIVMYGTSSGITKAGQQTLSRPGTNVHYGGTSSVGTHIAVGDYDNDGVLDIFACVAVPSAQDNFAAGVISYGRPGRGGWSSEVLADESILGVCVQPRTARINDDDVDDLVVGSATKRNMYVFFGASSRQLTRKTMSGPPSSVSFGKHTAIIDLDHDGQDDLVTCDEAHNSRRGKCYIYNALDLDTPVMTLIGRAAAEEFGSPVVAADLNCDGWDDLAITSRDGGIVSFFQRIPPPTTQPPPPTPVGEGEPGGASPTLFPASTTSGGGDTPVLAGSPRGSMPAEMSSGDSAGLQDIVNDISDGFPANVYGYVVLGLFLLSLCGCLRCSFTSRERRLAASAERRPVELSSGGPFHGALRSSRGTHRPAARTRSGARTNGTLQGGRASAITIRGSDIILPPAPTSQYPTSQYDDDII
uniref:Uncharacterized protein n=1 Tax=Sexangularia sp. CB-2014 TaxID=1486929 RepID=A0A7S1Y9Q1_9EUKA|mmetsp:Transcript_13354/g.42086  ORF Transcript_13354/g.42086 Transcript_13354/m.42086 type:complete len:593 (+) Transcript_13354:83-1861(+)